MNSARTRGLVAVMLSRFPLVTETFILREVIEMERQGQPVLLVPLIREEPRVVHPAARSWLRRALFTPYLSLPILASNFRAWRDRPLGHPRLLLSLLARAARSPGMLVRTAALLPKAVHLADRLRAEGVRHVHAHFATHPATVAMIVAELNSIEFSFTAHAHDLFVDRALLREKLASASFVRVISDFNREFLERHYPRETAGKLRVIHMGVDASRYTAARAANASQESGVLQLARRGTGSRPATAGPADGVPLVLTVAALKSYKGIDVLLDACAMLRDRDVAFRCDVIGDGPLRGHLAERIEAERLGDLVRLLGARTEDEVREWLGRATVFVLPSIVARNGQMEGIPVALMEAMAAGLPVVASSLSGIPELVVHGETGLCVEPGDAEALMAAMRRVLEDASLASGLGRRARSKVRGEFALEPTVSALLATLDTFGGVAEPELQRLLSESRWTGFAATRTVGVRRVRATRDSRVLQLLAEDGAEPRRLVLKVQRSRRGESRPPVERARHEFALLSTLREEAADTWPHCLVPRPLHLDEAAAAVVMEECRGERLDRLIRAERTARDPRRFAALLEAVRGAGVWLAAFQRQTVSLRPARPHVGRLLAGLEVGLRDCAERVFSRRETATVRARVEALRDAIRPGALRAVGHHGDFWPGNLFVGEDGVEAIDFEGYRDGLPPEDAGYFLAQLRLFFAYPGLTERGRRAESAFLEGYAAGSVEPVEGPAVTLCAIEVALRMLAREAHPAGGRIGGRWSRARRRRALTALVVGG